MVNEVLLEAQQRMTASVEAVARELTTVRTGRANTSILDEVVVDYYGAPTPLRQLASLSTPDPQMIVVQAYDTGSIPAIEKAILQADLGLNPSNDGNLVRVPIPELTHERREELARVVSRLAEEGKTGVRQIRRDANEQLKMLEQEKEISRDDEHRAHKTVQELTDKHCQRIDELADNKRQELLEI